MINYVNQMPGRSQGTSQQPYFHHPKHLTVYQLMWLLPYELNTVYGIKIDNHRAHCVYQRYIFVLINLSWFTHMLSQYNSNNVIIVICETPWMFLPLDILLEYWIVHVTFRLLYCPASRTTLVATRFRVAVICPIIQVPHCIRVFFYFVWFVFINHIFQFYYELCTYCNILDICLS